MINPVEATLQANNKRWAQNIARKNARFHKMSKTEKRMAIARDVLKQLRLEKYRACQGTYIHDRKYVLPYDHTNYDHGDSTKLQAILLSEKAPQCAVCAVGSAFLSLSRLGNNVSMASDKHQVLYSIFGKNNVTKMELIFEAVYPGYSDSYPKREHDFIKAYPKQNDRLVAIFRNIIRNQGIFKP